jgi:hypothetical protein
MTLYRAYDRNGLRERTCDAEIAEYLSQELGLRVTATATVTDDC